MLARKPNTIASTALLEGSGAAQLGLVKKRGFCRVAFSQRSNSCRHVSYASGFPQNWYG